MKIVCIGDSLTEGDYGIPGKSGIANVNREKNYPVFLAEMTGADVVNAGKCGYTSTSYLQYYKSGAVDVENADLVIVMLGSNGGVSADTEVPGNEDFRELLRLVAKDAPNAKTVLCTPPHATENPSYSNCGYAKRIAESVAFVRKLAKETSLPLIETALCPSFTAENEAVMQPNDGLHFGETGYRTLAAYILDALRTKKLI